MSIDEVVCQVLPECARRPRHGHIDGRDRQTGL